MHFGYGNILELGSVSVTSEAAGYPKYRLHDKDVSLPWKATSKNYQHLVVDMGSDKTASINRCIVAGHNLSGQWVWLYCTDDDPGGSPAWNYIGGENPSDDEGFEFSFSASNHRAFKLLCAQQLGITNLLAENCLDISGWTLDDNINGVSEVSPAGQFRMDANMAAADNRASRYRIISSPSNAFTVEIRLYHDALSSMANNDYFDFSYMQTSERVHFAFCSDGLFIYDTGSGWQEVGVNLVKYSGFAEWQTWRFVVTFTDVTGNGTCDIYLKDSTHEWIKVGTSIACSNESSWISGRVSLFQLGYTTNDMLTHVDYIRIAEGHFPPVISEISELYLGNSVEIIGYPVESVQVSPVHIRTRRETQSGAPWIIEEGPTKGSFNCNLNGLTDVQRGYILAADSEGFFFFIDHNGILQYVESKTKPNVVRVAADWFDVGVDFLEVDQL